MGNYEVAWCCDHVVRSLPSINPYDPIGVAAAWYRARKQATNPITRSRDQSRWFVKVFLYYIGKPKDPNANGLAEDFMTRAARYATTEMREIRPDRFDPWARHPTSRKMLCDPAGKVLDSAGFAALVSTAEREARDLLFVIGGHDGLPPGWASRADLLLSLSRMTFPHELARAMLAEQIYRAFASLRGHPYPR